jgi:hypothetical protein
MVPAWTTAAMLAALPPEGAGSWQDHLRMIWDLETTHGMNYRALAALQSWADRRQTRSISEPRGAARQRAEQREEQEFPPVPGSGQPADPTAALLRCPERVAPRPSHRQLASTRNPSS